MAVECAGDDFQKEETVYRTRKGKRMKYSIMYSSATGNTEKLAEAIRETLPAMECVYYGAPDAAALAADLIFVGFWTDKGSCDEKLQAFLAEMKEMKEMKRKKIALFGTAGFGREQSYFDGILERVIGILPAEEDQGEKNAGAVYLGGFMCQGRMQPSVRARYEAMQAADPADTKAKMLIDNFDAALSHPDKEDLERVKAWAKEIMNAAQETGGEEQ